MDLSRIGSRFGLALFALLWAAPAWTQGSLFEGPLIRFKEREVNFGDVKQATQASYRFEFSNDGTAPLKIEKVEASCGCTAAAPSDSLILPGHSSGIEITFSTRDFEGDVSKVVAVYTNDPGEPRIDLVLRANVIPLIYVEKDWVDFGQVPRGTNQATGILVSAEEGTDFKIERIKGGEAFVDWKIIPAAASDRIGYRVEAVLRSDVPLGPFADHVDIFVDHPNKQLVKVGLRGNVYSYFRYDAKAVEFSTIKLGKTIKRTLEIKSAGDKPYQITDVVLDVPYLSGEIARTDDGYELQLTLRTEDAQFTGGRFPFQETARLLTTDPNQKEILIEIKGLIRS
jgi:hypothetical protein